MAQRSNRVAWGITAVLAVVVLMGSGLLLKPYWVVRYRGQGANLQEAVLPFAPLQDVWLLATNLRRANLSGAVLRNASVELSDLEGAILRGADLRGSDFALSSLDGATLRDTDLRGADLEWAILKGADFAGAVYDATTRWPSGFDPQRHGAIVAK
jgi:hypothetical protein